MPTATDHPTRAKDLAHPLRHIFERHRDQDLAFFAAGLAFYALVSVAPVVIVVLWVTSALLGDERTQSLAHELERVAPQSLGADRALTEVAKLGSHLGLVSIVAAVWPASSYGAGLVRAFDRLSSGRGRRLKGLKGRALALLALLPAFIVGGLVSSYAGTALLGPKGSVWSSGGFSGCCLASSEPA
jgi:uncharacterized BrkB/YihY/UPF0761 family membrane protein